MPPNQDNIFDTFVKINDENIIIIVLLYSYKKYLSIYFERNVYYGKSSNYGRDYAPPVNKRL